MFDELQHFLLVVEHGTLTRAARAANLTQPALTASLQRLEAFHGARLLHRGRQGARLTPAGAALLPRARLALAAVDAGRRAVAEVEGLDAGEVRLGGGATACTYLLPPIVADFRRRYPGVTFRMRERYTPQVVDDLAAGRIDIGVAQGEPPPGRGDPWRDDPLVLVASPDQANRLMHDRRGALQPGTPFVTFQPGAALRKLLDQNLPDIDVVMELQSFAAAKGLVLAGIGVALLSRVSVEEDLEMGRLVEVEDIRAPHSRALCLRHAGLERIPPAAAALRELLLADGRTVPLR
ncbi:MAG: LysR family transcriptional regulator [Myxococcota bacterium]